MKSIVFALIGVVMSVGLFSASTPLASAQFEAAKDQACRGLQFDDDTSGDCDDSSSDKVDSVVATIINVASLAVGVISVIMVVVGGLKYVTSQGDSNGTASAKNTVIYAIVGLVIVLMSQILVRFVIDRAAVEPPARTQPSEVDVNCEPPVCNR